MFAIQGSVKSYGLVEVGLKSTHASLIIFPWYSAAKQQASDAFTRDECFSKERLYQLMN